MSLGDSFLARSQADKRAEARQRLNDLPARMLEISRSLSTELHTARTADPRSAGGQPLYTETGLVNHRRELANAAREQFTPTLDDLRDQVERDARLLREHADTVRPKIADDAGAQMRVQRRWDQARMKLDAGMPIRTVIDSTNDIDTLLAIAEWAPTYLEATSYTAPQLGSSYSPTDHSQLRRTIDARLAAVAGTDVAEALAAAADAERATAGYEQRAAYLEDMGTDTSVSALGSAIAANLAEQQSRVQIESAEPTMTDAEAS